MSEAASSFRKRKRAGASNEKTSKEDAYRESDPAMKLKCNALVCQMLEPYKGQRIMLLDGPEARTTQMLGEAGHALSDLVVFNWNEESSRSIRRATLGKTLVVVQDVTKGLLEWPLVVGSYNQLFAGGWLDFCGNAPRAVAAFRAMLLTRHLVADDASFAVTWCTRNPRGSTFSGEKHQHSYDGEAEIAQIAEEAGYALIKLHGAFVYKHMYYWSFRLRKCDFLHRNQIPTRIQQSELRQRVCTSNEYEVESLEERRWKNGAWFYHVKWVNYDELTWEPASAIDIDCPDLVAEFQNQSPHSTSLR